MEALKPISGGNTESKPRPVENTGIQKMRFVHPLHRGLGNSSYSLISFVKRGEEGYLKITFVLIFAGLRSLIFKAFILVDITCFVLTTDSFIHAI